MRSRTLLTQVLAVNAVLVAVTAFVAAIVARERLRGRASHPGLLLLGLAVLASSCSTRCCCATGWSRWTTSSRR